MQNLLERFTSFDNPNNVLLIPLPTGVGKTYNVMKYIASVVTSGDTRKVFYVTPLKKNLKSAREDLDKFLSKGGIVPDSVILNIDSITNYIIDNYSRLCREYSTLKADIIACLSDKERFEDFDSKIECFLELKESSKKGYNVSDKLIDRMKRDVLESEKKFRDSIHSMLPHVEPEEKLNRILENGSKWYWIPLLYPSVNTIRRQVYFLSVDKFISPHDTIIDRSYKFYESANMNDSIVILDEFDACKDTMLSHIIKDGLERIDYVGMFKTILLVLRDRKNIYVDYYKDSPSTIAKKGEGHVREKLEELSSSAETLCREFDLDLSFKSKDSTSGNFIFHDFRSLTVGKTGEFKILVDEKRRVHDILFEKNSSKSDFAITTMFSRLYSFFMEFNGFIRLQADNYIDSKRDSGTAFPKDSALNTMLVPFGFDNYQKDYILRNIRLMGRTKRTDDSRKYDASVYNTGIAYYDFDDNLNHDLSTTVYSTAFNLTPEKILLKTLERSGIKLIGISATAGLDSSVGNFHLYYLRHRAEWAEEIIRDEEWSRLLDLCKKSTAGYSNVNLCPIIIDGEDDGWFSEDQMVDAVFHDPGLYSRVKLQMASIKEHARKRYLKLAKAYKKFIQNDDMKSCLAFFSRSVRPMEKEEYRDSPFSKETIDWITRYIAEECGKPIPTGKFGFEVLTSLSNFEFENAMKSIRARLYDGEKLFIITTYASVGAGQNLQYPCPIDGEYVCINEFMNGGRASRSQSHDDTMNATSTKDFDGIYLDEPTMIVPIVKQDDKVSLVRALFVIEFLMEGHEISEQDARSAIKNSFKSYVEPVKYSIKTKNTKSIKMTYARQIIQAIGRICRTNIKNKNIYLMADANLKNVFTEPIDSYGKLRNPEFECVYEALSSYNGFHVTVEPQADGTDLASSRSYAEIQKYIKKRYWDEQLVDAWKDLRLNVLRKPVCEENPHSMFYYSYYCCADAPTDRLRYSEMYDYREVIVNVNGDREVSADAARLDRLLEIPGVREWFVSHDFATHWSSGCRIMSPVLFHNIYLGALGEESGRAILENWGLRLEELPAEIYERFDYRLNDAVYFDFKHHSGKLATDYDMEIDHICDKLSFINSTNGNDHAKKVYIINILENDERSIPLKTTTRGEFIIIEIPYLYDKNNVRNEQAYSMILAESFQGASDEAE